MFFKYSYLFESVYYIHFSCISTCLKHLTRNTKDIPNSCLSYIFVEGSSLANSVSTQEGQQGPYVIYFDVVVRWVGRVLVHVL